MEVKAGYKQSEVGEIPEDWEVKSILEFAPLQRGLDLPTSQLKPGIYPVVYSNGVLTTHATAMVKGPGVVTGRSGTIGKVHFVEDDYWPHNTTLWVTSFKGNNPKYAYYLYQKIGLERFGAGSGVPTLNRNDVHTFRIPIPPLPEQRAIAAALSDVDALISALDKLIAKKRGIKQATMQQLLTGKMRLSGFEGEWEVKRLGECLIGIPNYGINAPALPLTDRLPVYIRITDITSDGRFSPEQKTSVKGTDTEKYNLEEGDIVFARTGASVGKSYLYNPDDGELVFAGFLIRVKPNPAILNASFLSAYVKTGDYWNWVRIMSMRSGQPGINGTEYAQLPIPLPPLPEQHAIAAILSDMDAEITALEARRDKTRALKLSMMQELLTGKTRLV